MANIRLLCFLSGAVSVLLLFADSLLRSSFRSRTHSIPPRREKNEDIPRVWWAFIAIVTKCTVYKAQQFALYLWFSIVSAILSYCFIWVLQVVQYSSTIIRFRSCIRRAFGIVKVSKPLTETDFASFQVQMLDVLGHNHHPDNQIDKSILLFTV